MIIAPRVHSGKIVSRTLTSKKNNKMACEGACGRECTCGICDQEGLGARRWRCKCVVDTWRLG